METQRTCAESGTGRAFLNGPCLVEKGPNQRASLNLYTAATGLSVSPGYLMRGLHIVIIITTPAVAPPAQQGGLKFPAKQKYDDILLLGRVDRWGT